MCQISIYEAKTQFSKYISLLENGQEKEIIILKNGKPVAKLAPHFLPETKRHLGAGLALSEAMNFVLKEDGEDFGDLFGY